MFRIEFDRIIPYEIIAKNFNFISIWLLNEKQFYFKPVIIFYFSLQLCALFCLAQSIGRISPNEEIATD